MNAATPGPAQRYRPCQRRLPTTRGLLSLEMQP